MGRTPKRSRTDAEVAKLAARFGVDWNPADAVETWLRRHARELSLIVRDDGWSWTDVGRALAAAGIAYRTGRPWSAPILRKKVCEAAGIARRGAPLPEQAEAVASALRGALSSLGGIQHVHVHMGGPSPTPPQPAAAVPAPSPPPLPGPVAAATGTPTPRAANGGSLDRPALAAKVPRDPAAAPSPEAGEDDGPRFELASFADGWTPPPQPEQPGEKKPPPKPRRRFDPDEVLRRLDGVSTPSDKQGKD